jgi:hypothetical protein
MGIVFDKVLKSVILTGIITLKINMLPGTIIDCSQAIRGELYDAG